MLSSTGYSREACAEEREMLTPGKGHEEILQRVQSAIPVAKCKRPLGPRGTPVPFRNTSGTCMYLRTHDCGGVAVLFMIRSRQCKNYEC